MSTAYTIAILILIIATFASMVLVIESVNYPYYQPARQACGLFNVESSRLFTMADGLEVSEATCKNGAKFAYNSGLCRSHYHTCPKDTWEKG